MTWTFRCGLSIFMLHASLTASIIPARALETHLVGIGGNSECIHNGGTWQLLFGNTDRQGKIRAPVALESLKELIGVQENNVHYFSWTGDLKKDHDNCLPGRVNYIKGGSEFVEQKIQDITRQGPSKQLVIIGWSNGGATAYELACRLTKTNPSAVQILVTLDPASWTTDPCLNGSGEPIKPALHWLSVYTKSDAFLQRLEFGNIIAYFGRAWNETFPARGRPDVLKRLQPAAHGHVECMWRKCVLGDKTFQSWVGGRRSAITLREDESPKNVCWEKSACIPQ